MNFVEELKWRGKFQDMVSETEEYMLQHPTTGYIGFDPTGDSLHLGSFQQIILLKRLQLAGHKPIALMGGATGRVGDPTGKTEERQLLSIDEIQHNIDGIQAQLSKFIEFGTGSHDAQLVNNYDWFKEFSFLDFIREAGKHITVSYMMSKDSVQNRLETGLSFTEFTYQLIQGYDFYHLFKHYDCKLQLGGSDQWGNITTGVELIRRKMGEKSYAITSPLILRADGTKFGKTAGGENIWLDGKKTSPYKFYQFILNRGDDEIINLNRRFSFKTHQTIEELEAKHRSEPQLRILQKSLGEELTTMVHSADDYAMAVKTTDLLFHQPFVQAVHQLDDQTISDLFEGIPRFQVSKTCIEAGIGIIPLLVQEAKIYQSNGEARRLLVEKAISINKSKIDENRTIDTADIMRGKYILIQQGKKKDFLIELI